MKNFSRLVAGLLLCAAVLSCEDNTFIKGVVKDGPEKDVIVKLLDVNRFEVLDTVKTDAEGKFEYALALAEAQPEFIYLFYGDRKIASLLLEKGDEVKVETDTLGAYRVAGSEESLLLQKVENAYNECVRDLSRILVNPLQGNAALSRRYIAYYRDRVKYVMDHPYSLTVVPVFFQQLNDGLPVFSQNTDGLLMRNIADSLATRYPESRYVEALQKEAERRINQMEINTKLGQAEEVGFFDIDLPSLQGKKEKLSDHIGKVTMLYFWSPTAEQKMFNLDTLMPIYEEFHGKGLEIYAVALNADKHSWATAVRNQHLPWVNVCDIRAEESPLVYTYGLTTLPMAWYIVDGVIDPDARTGNAKEIRAYLKKKL